MKKDAKHKTQNHPFPQGIALSEGVKIRYQTKKAAQGKTVQKEFIRQDKGKSQGGKNNSN